MYLGQLLIYTEKSRQSPFDIVKAGHKRVKLKKHNRYDYSPIIDRADYDWPDGKRLAVYFAMNIEHFSFGEGLGHTPTNPGPQPDVRNFAWRDYGLRVGIWRIFDLLDELGLPACHLMNSSIYDYAPEIPERIRQRGDEFVGHGRTNSDHQSDYSEDDDVDNVNDDVDDGIDEAEEEGGFLRRFYRQMLPCLGVN